MVTRLLPLCLLLATLAASGCSVFFGESVVTGPEEDAGGEDVQDGGVGLDTLDGADEDVTTPNMGTCESAWSADVSGCNLWRLVADPGHRRIYGLGSCQADGGDSAAVVVLDACTGVQTSVIRLAPRGDLSGAWLEGDTMHVVGRVRDAGDLDRPFYALLDLRPLSPEPIVTRWIDNTRNGALLDVGQDGDGNLWVTGFVGNWGLANRTLRLDVLDRDGQARCTNNLALPPLSMGKRIHAVDGALLVAGMVEGQARVWEPTATCDASGCQCDLGEKARWGPPDGYDAFEAEDFLVDEGRFVAVGGGWLPMPELAPTLSALTPGSEATWDLRAADTNGLYRAVAAIDGRLVAAGVVQAPLDLSGDDWGQGVLTMFNADTLLRTVDVDVGRGIVTDLCIYEQSLVVAVMNGVGRTIRRCTSAMQCGP